MVEDQEKKRAQEWNKREEKIMNFMNKMADQVVSKNN